MAKFDKAQKAGRKRKNACSGCVCNGCTYMNSNTCSTCAAAAQAKCPDCSKPQMPMKPRRHKFNATKTEYNGRIFDSKGEARRAEELDFMMRAGEISELEYQHIFQIEVNGMKICKYHADFVYKDKEGNEVVEDYKGKRTDVYMLKKKLMKACHGIEIKEITYK